MINTKSLLITSDVTTSILKVAKVEYKDAAAAAAANDKNGALDGGGVDDASTDDRGVEITQKGVRPKFVGRRTTENAGVRLPHPILVMRLVAIALSSALVICNESPINSLGFWGHVGDAIAYICMSLAIFFDMILQGDIPIFWDEENENEEDNRPPENPAETDASAKPTIAGSPVEPPDRAANRNEDGILAILAGDGAASVEHGVERNHAKPKIGENRQSNLEQQYLVLRGYRPLIDGTDFEAEEFRQLRHRRHPRRQ